MPDPKNVTVTLRVDLRPLVRAARRAARTLEEFRRRLDRAAHQRRETPTRSAMHAAYDRRRRARRRRGRR